MATRSTAASPGPIPLRDGSPTASTSRRPSASQVGSPGTRGAGKGSSGPTSSSTNCTWGHSRRKGRLRRSSPGLAELRDLGITAIELMPVAQFPGSRSWGYDGVFPFAVQNTYGGPEALKQLVEACHRTGLAVFLDAIFNHYGPEGNVLPAFGDYLTSRYKTDWGDAVNYDDHRCDPVRASVLDNVRMWIRRIPIRRASARCRRPDLRPRASAHPVRDRRGRASGGRPARPEGPRLRRDRPERRPPLSPIARSGRLRARRPLDR